MIRALLSAAMLALLGMQPAQAHPHIFIDAEAEIVLDEAGALTEIRHRWTFDEAFSVWQVQGLDVDGDGITSSQEMQELADENMVGLAEYNFYTSAGEGRQSVTFSATGPALFSFADGRSTLEFSVVPDEPFHISRALEVSIADPEYYVAINFAGLSDVALQQAPPGCDLRLQPGREMPDDVATELYSLPPDVTRLPPALEAALRGVQGAIIVDCSSASFASAPATALEAAEAMAEVRPAMPFGGPPQEPGFTLPNTGFLGWLRQTQEDFYRLLTAALGSLQQDGNAFWILGGLSFLYGVFHAAGPGHGKVVIGSYMLANEGQLRRGIGLSFAAALTQSLVAIVFVGTAAGVLGLSSAVMNNAVGWIEKAAYGMVMLLGLWLVLRKLFGLGHKHDHGSPSARDGHHHAHGSTGHADDSHRAAAHRHHDHEAADAGHSHHHVVAPADTGGDWREQLGVVLGVGLRPCSGALVVLVFALSQGVLLAGIAAVVLMGLGTALTVATLAVLAVSAKGLARRWLSADDGFGNTVVWWVELAGAFTVLAFGAALLLASL